MCNHLCMCLCAPTYVHSHVFAYAFIFLCLFACIQACEHICVCIIFVWMHTCNHLCVSYVHTCVHKFGYTHTSIYVCVYTYSAVSTSVHFSHIYGDISWYIVFPWASMHFCMQMFVFIYAYGFSWVCSLKCAYVLASITELVKVCMLVCNSIWIVE